MTHRNQETKAHEELRVGAPEGHSGEKHWLLVILSGASQTVLDRQPSAHLSKRKSLDMYPTLDLRSFSSVLGSQPKSTNSSFLFRARTTMRLVALWAATLALAGLGSWCWMDVLRSPNPCKMSFMAPRYFPVAVPDSDGTSYQLFEYRDQRQQKYVKSGHVVLFIPGHGGRCGVRQ